MSDRDWLFDSTVDYEREASRDPGLPYDEDLDYDRPDAGELAELAALNRRAVSG